MKVGKGPAKIDAVKITDNSVGWAEVANIPVPPAADIRDFSQPLGKAPVLLNGGKFIENNDSTLSPEETTVSQGFSQKPENNTELVTKLKLNFTVEINWYGSRLAVDCLNAVYQPGDFTKGVEGLLLLELPIMEKTQAPAWTPPVAHVDQNGKMYLPEFECTIFGQKLQCQVLNIDIEDLNNKKRLFVFRVLDLT